MLDIKTESKLDKQADNPLQRTKQASKQFWKARRGLKSKIINLKSKRASKVEHFF
jgi:hypothetical protein